MASVTLNAVSKQFGRGRTFVEAVREVSLHIEDGEYVVLLGPSGCGKTTTLRMIAGLETPSAGSIRIGDVIVDDLAPRDRDVAMVFQHYALYPHLSVYKNLSFALRVRRMPKAEIDRRVRSTASLLGIGDLLDCKPWQLSGGQKQRVALGRAIVRAPKVCLFDEPLSNLDATLRLQTRSELKRLQRRLGTTVVHVTHDQEEALTLGDRIVVMDEGRIHQCGTPIDVYRAPADRFVAGFIGTPSMAFFEGRLEYETGRLAFVLPDEVALTIGRNGESFGPIQVESLVSRRGTPLVLGVRPEAWRLDRTVQAGGGDDCVPTASVCAVEPLADRVYVHLELAGGRRFVVTDSSTATAGEPALRPGESVGLRLNAIGAHLFETGDCGRRVQVCP